MNIKRYLGAALALFVFMFFYDWIVHGMLLMNMYVQTSTIWRPFSDMMAEIPCRTGYQLLIALWTTLAFTQLFKEGGTLNGLRFGLYFGVFAGLLTAAWYIWLPVPALLALAWFISSTGLGVCGGLLIGSIYRKEPI